MGLNITKAELDTAVQRGNYYLIKRENSAVLLKKQEYEDLSAALSGVKSGDNTTDPLLVAPQPKRTQPVVAPKAEPKKTQAPAAKVQPVVAPKVEPKQPQAPAAKAQPVVAPKVEPKQPQAPAAKAQPVVAPKAEPAKTQTPAAKAQPVVAPKAEPAKTQTPAAKAQPEESSWLTKAWNSTVDGITTATKATGDFIASTSSSTVDGITTATKATGDFIASATSSTVDGIKTAATVTYDSAIQPGAEYVWEKGIKRPFVSVNNADDRASLKLRNNAWGTKTIGAVGEWVGQVPATASGAVDFVTTPLEKVNDAITFEAKKGEDLNIAQKGWNAVVRTTEFPGRLTQAGCDALTDLFRSGSNTMLRDKVLAPTLERIAGKTVDTSDANILDMEATVSLSKRLGIPAKELTKENAAGLKTRLEAGIDALQPTDTKQKKDLLSLFEVFDIQTEDGSKFNPVNWFSESKSVFDPKQMTAEQFEALQEKPETMTAAQFSYLKGVVQKAVKENKDMDYSDIIVGLIHVNQYKNMTDSQADTIISSAMLENSDNNGNSKSAGNVKLTKQEVAFAGSELMARAEMDRASKLAVSDGRTAVSNAKRAGQIFSNLLTLGQLDFKLTPSNEGESHYTKVIFDSGKRTYEDAKKATLDKLDAKAQTVALAAEVSAASLKKEDTNEFAIKNITQHIENQNMGKFAGFWDAVDAATTCTDGYQDSRSTGGEKLKDLAIGVGRETILKPLARPVSALNEGAMGAAFHSTLYPIISAVSALYKGYQAVDAMHTTKTQTFEDTQWNWAWIKWGESATAAAKGTATALTNLTQTHDTVFGINQHIYNRFFIPCKCKHEHGITPVVILDTIQTNPGALPAD